ncbi:S-adenosyl-L-methionine-dependent methyltransferase [Suillus bovinus]|uniref:S-adenosyl-L-methionine-dependent methyltransferase n=1 Tax=Suillus bovinus TaxID=48563 RepID=UPI001B885E12|nr:S-adenosyl-L-methionine-dependent methyltransferase [Suillus bovinus]KAG2151080.1 S-adenosyl-L-methionine-dependent methyltransferase [Suillus bovinus]
MTFEYTENMPHDEDDASDASSDVTELEELDFPDHFFERDGRLFHSHGSLPYPLPVDGPEQARLNSIHRILRDTVESLYLGPVTDVLSDARTRQRRVLDLCTGTGQWPMDMARSFPLSRSTVPIATRRPLPHVQFEIHDITERFRWNNGAMDFVHARNIDLAITDYPELLREVARLLRPGGLFFSGEIGRYIDVAHGSSFDLARQAPHARDFFQAVNHSLELRHLVPIADRVPSFIQQSRHFTVPTIQTFHIPWRVGKMYLAALKDFAESLKPMLREAGMTQLEINTLVTGFIEDIERVPGLVGVYHTAWARKL